MLSGANMEQPSKYSANPLPGFDHGVGHPPLLLCNTKAPNYRNKKAFKDLGHYSEWPKVADAVIEARCPFRTNSILQKNLV